MKRFTVALFLRRWLLLVSCAVVTASASGQSAPVLLPQVQTFSLSNGMTLFVQPDRRAPTAVHMLWVRVGSMDEVDGTSGVAHVLEHMMFKGTPSVPEGEFSRQVARLGGRDNAFTSRDVTVFHQQVPNRSLEDVMRLEADRFANSSWSDDAFQREIRVVQEERRQRIEESPQALMFEAFNAMAYSTHPYRRPIIGWESDLRSMTPDDVREFHRRWYVPDNAAVVVVGDVDVAQVRVWAEKYYGAIKARPLSARKTRVEVLQSGERRMVYRAKVSQPLLVMGYKMPSLQAPGSDDAGSRDALALALLAGVLDGHRAARLNRTLVQGHGLNDNSRLADEVSASFGFIGRGPQMFTFMSSPVSGVAPDRLEKGIVDEIRRVAEQGVSEAELQRVKNQWIAGEVFKRDSLFAQAREIGSGWVQGWPVDAAQTIMQRLREVTPAQVQDVASRYFKSTQLNVGLLLPQEAP